MVSKNADQIYLVWQCCHSTLYASNLLTWIKQWGPTDEHIQSIVDRHASAGFRFVKWMLCSCGCSTILDACPDPGHAIGLPITLTLLQFCLDSLAATC
jgi:hypothetical protein